MIILPAFFFEYQNLLTVIVFIKYECVIIEARFIILVLLILLID